MQQSIVAIWEKIALGMVNPAAALIKGDLNIEGGSFNLARFMSLFDQE